MSDREWQTKSTRTGPPEESLCGEEEALAAGLIDPEVVEEIQPGVAEEPMLHAWAQHCRGVGRSRTKAYAQALALAEAQWSAWALAFPEVASAAYGSRGLPKLNEREREMLGYFSAGYAAFLRDVRMIAEEGGR